MSRDGEAGTFGDPSDAWPVMMLIRFHRDAPTIVRLTAVLILAGSVLEAFMTLAHRAPSAQTMLELWRAWVSPVATLCLGFMFAGGLGRLVGWVYWLALLIWVPFVLIFSIVAVVLGLRHPNPGLSLSVGDLCGYVAMTCYLVACVLLPMKASRRAFENAG